MLRALLSQQTTYDVQTARNGFEALRSTQSFATGGWGPDENFRKPGSGEVGESLKTSHASFETPCGAYGHFKITRYLLRVTRDSRYGDSMERVLYNTILGVKPLKEDGTSFYYSDYNNQFAKKGYYRDKWPCCSGTFPQITADYGISSYLKKKIPTGIPIIPVTAANESVPRDVRAIPDRWYLAGHSHEPAPGAREGRVGPPRDIRGNPAIGRVFADRYRAGFFYPSSKP